MKVYAWLIDLIHRRKNCPTGMISGWVQKVTEHRRTIPVLVRWGWRRNLAKKIWQKIWPKKAKRTVKILGVGLRNSRHNREWKRSSVEELLTLCPSEKDGNIKWAWKITYLKWQWTEPWTDLFSSSSSFCRGGPAWLTGHPHPFSRSFLTASIKRWTRFSSCSLDHLPSRFKSDPTINPCACFMNACRFPVVIPDPTSTGSWTVFWVTAKRITVTYYFAFQKNIHIQKRFQQKTSTVRNGS